MATVYLAEDIRHHRQVAVKVLRAELAATLGSDRFFREIEVAARLQRPNILPLLDSGEANGFYYYVMPFLAGESLRERLARVGELPEALRPPRPGDGLWRGQGGERGDRPEHAHDRGRGA
jgi:serine/threonine protein kinase